MKIQDGSHRAVPARPLPMGWFSRDVPTHFPPVTGTRLDGTPLALPADLPADATVLVVSFRDDLDAVSDQWARLVERMAEGRTGRVAVLELPVMGRAMRHLGDVGTMSVRGHVEGDAETARTVPIYVDKKAFRKALGLRGSNEVTAFLVDREGAIAWTGSGDIDMDEVSALDVALAELLRRAPAAVARLPEPAGDAGTDGDGTGDRAVGSDADPADVFASPEAETPPAE